MKTNYVDTCHEVINLIHQNVHELVIIKISFFLIIFHKRDQLTKAKNYAVSFLVNQLFRIPTYYC